MVKIDRLLVCSVLLLKLVVIWLCTRFMKVGKWLCGSCVLLVMFSGVVCVVLVCVVLISLVCRNCCSIRLCCCNVC